MLGGQVFAAIDGRFPDYRRVIPMESSLTGEAGQFNPDLVNKCVKSIREFYGMKKDSNEWGMRQSGLTNSAVIFGSDASCITVVMPMNGGKKEEPLRQFHGFLTPTQSFQKAA